jgi:hypothetical protein
MKGTYLKAKSVTALRGKPIALALTWSSLHIHPFVGEMGCRHGGPEPYERENKASHPDKNAKNLLKIMKTAIRAALSST